MKKSRKVRTSPGIKLYYRKNINKQDPITSYIDEDTTNKFESSSKKYLKIRKPPKRLKFSNIDNVSINIAVDVLPSVISSELLNRDVNIVEVLKAKQYSKSIKLNKNEIVNKLHSCGGIFQVEFTKLPNATSIASIIRKTDTTYLSDENLLSIVNKQILIGDKRVLIGCLLGVDLEMGITKVLEFNDNSATIQMRQFYNKNIISLIVDNCKYYCK